VEKWHADHGKTVRFCWRSGTHYVKATFRVGLGLGLGGAETDPQNILSVREDLFNGNNFALSAALVAVCALPSAVLVLLLLCFTSTKNVLFLPLCVCLSVGRINLEKLRTNFDEIFLNGVRRATDNSWLDFGVEP